MKRCTHLFPLCLTWVACNGTDVGNPRVDIDAAMVRKAFTHTASDASAPDHEIVIDSAWINVSEIRLRPASDCSGGAELELQGPFAIDLLAPGPMPELSDLSITETDYCRFELRWDPLDEAVNGAPDELAGASIVLGGTRGDGTRFLLRTERNDQLRLDAIDGSFPVTEATSALFVAFDGEQLFQNVDLENAELDADGVIQIDDQANEALLTAFEASLDSATRLFDDSDHDGELDQAESATEQALAE